MVPDVRPEGLPVGRAHSFFSEKVLQMAREILHRFPTDHAERELLYTRLLKREGVNGADRAQNTDLGLAPAVRELAEAVNDQVLISQVCDWKSLEFGGGEIVR